MNNINKYYLHNIQNHIDVLHCIILIINNQAVMYCVYNIILYNII